MSSSRARAFLGLLAAVFATGAWLLAASAFSHPLGSSPSTTRPVTITVDASTAHQRIDGFGATTVSLVFGESGEVDNVATPALRARAIEAVYGQVKITMGYLNIQPVESRGPWESRGNDNSDAFAIDWSGFDPWRSDAFKKKVLDPARPLGFTNFFLSKVDTRWASPWLVHLKQANYQLYLDEVAEQVVATHILWRDRYGLVPSYFLLFNEPLSGNGELIGGSTKEIVDIVKRAGQRLRGAGFQTKFVVPNEETEELSLERARAILADPEARRYVGAIGYHPYPYGSVYAAISNILDTSGAGRPDPGRVAVRRELRDLAARYGIPLWMTEVSNGGVDVRSFDNLRGRAIHIHDEFVYANASAYFGMNNMWDTTTHDEHFRGRAQEGKIFSEEGTIAVIDNRRRSVIITGMGYAIGHYARWVRPGSRRVEAASSDVLVQVTAFRDNSRKRLVWVVINNSPSTRIVRFRTNGVRLVGSLVGEQSTAVARWRTLRRILPARPAFTVTVPPESVTTIERRFA